MCTGNMPFINNVNVLSKLLKDDTKIQLTWRTDRFLLLECKLVLHNTSDEVVSRQLVPLLTCHSDFCSGCHRKESFSLHLGPAVFQSCTGFCRWEWISNILSVWKTKFKREWLLSGLTYKLNYYNIMFIMNEL